MGSGWWSAWNVCTGETEQQFLQLGYINEICNLSLSLLNKLIFRTIETDRHHRCVWITHILRESYISVKSKQWSHYLPKITSTDGCLVDVGHHSAVALRPCNLYQCVINDCTYLCVIKSPIAGKPLKIKTWLVSFCLHHLILGLYIFNMSNRFFNAHFYIYTPWCSVTFQCAHIHSLTRAGTEQIPFSPVCGLWSANKGAS